MAKVLVLYYSMYGHIETMAQEVAEGTRGAGADVDVKRVPEIMPRDVAEQAGVKLEQDAPVAQVADLANYDAVIFGTPTRFGNMAAQMRNFLDQTGGMWMSGTLVGKIGSVFTSTATGGGNETTITTFWPTLAHHGMIIVGVHYGMAELTDLTVVKGGSPYGAGMIAGPKGDRWPNEQERSLARQQGAHVAQIAAKLAG